MSAADLYAACREIADSLGPKAEVSASVSAFVYAANGPSVSIHPNGIGNSGGTRCFSDTWQGALAAAREWAAAYVPKQDETLIRRLALAIIDLSEPGQALTVPALRQRGFSTEEITEHHAAACALATAKCNGAAFSVVPG